MLFPNEYKDDTMEFGMLVYRCNIWKSEVVANPDSEEDNCVYK